MPFSSLAFVCAFLPLCLFVCWIMPMRARNGAVLAFSVLFYAWGAPRFLPVVLALGVIDWLLARNIASAKGRTRIALLALGITTHVSVLAYFKYANFAVDQVNTLRGALSLPVLRWVRVALPIGVSFLTFEEISYLVDVHRGDAQPAKRWSHYLLFLMLFPHSIAGPIFRWKDLAAQFAARRYSLADVSRGMTRFSLGLAKKVIVADSAGYVVDGIFKLNPGEVSASYAWVGALGYAIQIYFDFSGYSDMAIGLGAMLGFRFKENFREPYTSRSMSEFWQRWHISLSTWMRDYLYIPLGGNRRGRHRAELNALFVFAVSGLWHGAAWTFLLWGVYHGLLVLVERRLEPWIGGVPARVRALCTFALVVVGWVPFRASGIGQTGVMLRAMFGFAHLTAEPSPLPAEAFPRFETLVFAGAVAWVLARMLAPRREEATTSVDAWWRPLVSVGLLALCVVHMTNTRYTPLIYFKF